MNSAHVLHAIDGRLRIKVSSIKNDAKRAAAMCAALRRVPGVERVVPNPVIGSITITYDDTRIDGAAICREVAVVVGHLTMPEPGEKPTPAASPVAALPSAFLAGAGNAAVKVILKTAMEAAVRHAIYSLV